MQHVTNFTGTASHNADHSAGTYNLNCTQLQYCNIQYDNSVRFWWLDFFISQAVCGTYPNVQYRRYRQTTFCRCLLQYFVMYNWKDDNVLSVESVITVPWINTVWRLHRFKCNQVPTKFKPNACESWNTISFYVPEPDIMYLPVSACFLICTFCFSRILDFSECIMFHIRTRADMKYYAPASVEL